MARMDFDSRRRNSAGKLIGGHTSRPDKHEDEWPPRPTYKPGRKRTRRTLGATVKHQAQPPVHIPKHTVDAYIITLYGMGTRIAYAHDAATALHALRHRDARRAGGVSIHGWIDGVQYSGAMSLCFLHELLS
jgi:hypothetical protein